MHSKNKPRQTALEQRYVEALAEQPCVVCGEGPVEIHEFEQGAWFASVPVCYECHRGSKGWHGTRERWTRAKVDMVEAINRAVGRVWAR